MQKDYVPQKISNVLVMVRKGVLQSCVILLLTGLVLNRLIRVNTLEVNRLIINRLTVNDIMIVGHSLIIVVKCCHKSPESKEIK